MGWDNNSLGEEKNKRSLTICAESAQRSNITGLQAVFSFLSGNFIDFRVENKTRESRRDIPA